MPEDAAAKTKATLLICHGAVDPFIDADELTSCIKSMDSGKFDYQFISYAGAIHAFTNPGADKLAAANNRTGKVGYNAAVDERSWDRMKLFFTEVLGK